MMARMTWARPRRVAGWLLAVVAAVVLVVTVFNRPGLPQFTPSGDPRPLPAEGELRAVSLKDFEGILVGQRGKPVVVNVWASWCAPCRTEMPLLQRAARTYAGRAVVLGVASKDDPDAAKAFLTKLGLTYPSVFDTTGEIRVRLGLTAYPTTYVFSAEGVLTARVSGGISEQRLGALIDDALR
jgi:cytochrome c biogenesis protein CcmG, thiol:disulfide interchange protein DsbE